MLPLFTIQFPLPLHLGQIEMLRHTFIIEAFKNQLWLGKHYLHPDLFVNETADGITYDRYPLIQYKILDNYAAVIGMAEGAVALELLWHKWTNPLLYNTPYPLTKQTAAGRPDTFSPAILLEQEQYTLTHWMPLNTKEEGSFESLNETEQCSKLKEKLYMHIGKWAEGCRLDIMKDVHMEALGVYHKAPLLFKTKNRLVCNASFTVNMLLPEGIGLGNSPAFGFGKIQYQPVINSTMEETKEAKEQALVL